MKFVMGFVIALIITGSSFAADFIQYRVIGYDRTTKESVIGYVIPNSIDNSILIGDVKYVGTKDVVSVTGTWSGLGMMELHNEKNKKQIFDVEVEK